MILVMSAVVAPRLLRHRDERGRPDRHEYVRPDPRGLPRPLAIPSDQHPEHGGDHQPHGQLDGLDRRQVRELRTQPVDNYFHDPSPFRAAAAQVNFRAADLVIKSGGGTLRSCR